MFILKRACIERPYGVHVVYVDPCDCDMLVAVCPQINWYLSLSQNNVYMSYCRHVATYVHKLYQFISINVKIMAINATLWIYRINKLNLCFARKTLKKFMIFIH